MPAFPTYRKGGTIWRYPSPPLDEVWTRAVANDDGTDRLTIVRFEGSWNQVLDDGWFVPLPGARDFTVSEYVGNRTRTTQRYGEWIELSAEVASSVEPLRKWCFRVSNSQLPAGGFRFSPAVWRERSKDVLAIPYVAELDHPDSTIRGLAAVERRRRILVTSLEETDRRRRELIRSATNAGYSRRALGSLLGLSFGRVQQLLRD
jgi:hypothetical protein